MDWLRATDWWGLAPYWVPVIIAAVAVVVLASAARARTRRSARHRPASSSSVDAFYLDSSHMGEPESRGGVSGYSAFNAGRAGAHKRRAKHSRRAS
jgi:hypothetical protein